MNTSTLTNVLKEHRTITKVELSPKDSQIDAKSWINLSCDLYRDIQNPDDNSHLDSDVYTALLDFKNDDPLESVNRNGKIVKRFARYFKERCGYKLPEYLQGVLGDKIQYHISKESKTFYVDFTNDINWRDGQFGKRGSCWWGTYADSRPTFESAGGYGIRFYMDENQDDNNGIARTWILPKDGMLMCFNSYGFERPTVSKVIKAIYAQHGITLHYKAVELYNGQNDCIPYINSGTGFILYPDGIDAQSLDERYDVDIEVEEDERSTCENCGHRIDDDEMVIVGYDCYCQSCCDRLFSFCDICQEYCAQDEVHPFQGRKYDYLCRDCAEIIGAIECADCGDYTDDGICTEDTNECYCQNCDDNYHYCDTCENYYSEEHDHTEDEESEDESTDESGDEDESSDELDSSITFQVETVTYKSNKEELKTITQPIYRHVNIQGLYLWKYDDEEYNITHEPSGQAVKSGIPSLDLALRLLKRLQGLCDWNISGYEIMTNKELCAKVLEIRQEVLGRF